MDINQIMDIMWLYKLDKELWKMDESLSIVEQIQI